jgi:hypothetical protein
MSISRGSAGKASDRFRKKEQSAYLCLAGSLQIYAHSSGTYQLEVLTKLTLIYSTKEINLSRNYSS